MVGTSTCSVAILISFGIRLMVAQSSPSLPYGVGSCLPLNDSEIRIIIKFNQQFVRIIRYQIVCEVPGLFLGTVSQSAIMAQYECPIRNRCDYPYYISMFIVMCHSSTNSFIRPSMRAYNGRRMTNYLANGINFNPPPKRSNCAMCAIYYSKRFVKQPCQGMAVEIILIDYCIV